MELSRFLYCHGELRLINTERKIHRVFSVEIIDIEFVLKTNQVATFSQARSEWPECFW